MIKLLVIGKLDYSYWQQAANDYFQRINHYNKLTIIEIPEVVQYDDKKNQQQQTEVMIKTISSYSDYYKVLLAIDGQPISSISLAQLLQEQKDYAQNKIIFILGGSLGFNDKLDKIVNQRISLGKITLPHQLCRIVLLEQIYRAYKINNHEKYHK